MGINFYLKKKRSSRETILGKSYKEGFFLRDRTWAWSDFHASFLRSELYKTARLSGDKFEFSDANPWPDKTAKFKELAPLDESKPWPDKTPKFRKPKTLDEKEFGRF